MKQKHALVIGLLALGSLLLFSWNFQRTSKRSLTAEKARKGCVFMSVMGESTLHTLETDVIYSEAVSSALKSGVLWMAKAQQPNGGWGCGSHSAQHVRDPQAVDADPATTAMVCMALLRNQDQFSPEEFKRLLNGGIAFLQKAVENAPANSTNITDLQNTQIQTKLGRNIDVVLTAQFLSNLLETDYLQLEEMRRVKSNLQACVLKIQSGQLEDGSMSGSGWAGVLQSSLATNAIESAQQNGVKVDTVKLEKSRAYQTGNYNANTGEVKTERGAGVVLYSVSGSTRSSAKDAREAQRMLDSAKAEGIIEQEAPMSADNLEKIGMDRTKAMKYSTSYNVYQSGKEVAQSDQVLKGFGNDGGEEFISFLQTGESLMIANDSTWGNWYQKTAAHLVGIQNQDGSWNGHHCITSPVFCTATCLLVLSIEEDKARLNRMGQ
jgi:hypothetical protein